MAALDTGAELVTKHLLTGYFKYSGRQIIQLTSQITRGPCFLQINLPNALSVLIFLPVYVDHNGIIFA